MAKLTSRRRSALDNPEEVLNLAQRLVQRLKPHARWLVLAGVVIAVGLGAWGVTARMQASRQVKAAAVESAFFRVGSFSPRSPVRTSHC
ncbi:MAG: hypothetical protein ACLQUS_02725 [Desulfobaccales bacterium]